MALKLLVEGMSIRAAERVTGVHRDTIYRLLKTVGEKCERVMAALVKAAPVKDVEMDEIWSFVGMKQATKKERNIQGLQVGDAWTFAAVERVNLSIRTPVKRFNRLTCCFSKKLANHKAAFALFALHFNFCCFHRSLRMTPAMNAGIATAPWSLADLLVA